jgi:hypothetical protein
LTKKPKNIDPKDWVRDYLKATGWQIGSPLYKGVGCRLAVVSKQPHKGPRQWRLLSYSNKNRTVTVGHQASLLKTGGDAFLICALTQGGISMAHAEREIVDGAATYPRVPIVDR